MALDPMAKFALETSVHFFFNIESFVFADLNDADRVTPILNHPQLHSYHTAWHVRREVILLLSRPQKSEGHRRFPPPVDEDDLDRSSHQSLGKEGSSRWAGALLRPRPHPSPPHSPMDPSQMSPWIQVHTTPIQGKSKKRRGLKSMGLRLSITPTCSTQPSVTHATQVIDIIPVEGSDPSPFPRLTTPPRHPLLSSRRSQHDKEPRHDKTRRHRPGFLEN